MTQAGSGQVGEWGKHRHEILPVLEFHLQLRAIAPDQRRVSAKQMGGIVTGDHPQKRGDREESRARIEPLRRGVRKENLARTESEAGDPRSERETGRVASGSGAAQHLGRDATRRVLEIRSAQKDRRRKEWPVRVEGKEFFHAAGKRKSGGSGVARRQERA